MYRSILTQCESVFKGLIEKTTSLLAPCPYCRRTPRKCRTWTSDFPRFLCSHSFHSSSITGFVHARQYQRTTSAQSPPSMRPVQSQEAAMLWDEAVRCVHCATTALPLHVGRRSKQRHPRQPPSSIALTSNTRLFGSHLRSGRGACP